MTRNRLITDETAVFLEYQQVAIIKNKLKGKTNHRLADRERKGTEPKLLKVTDPAKMQEIPHDPVATEIISQHQENKPRIG